MQAPTRSYVNTASYVLLALLPAAAYYAFVIRLSQNIPYMDDYLNSLGFLSSILATDSWTERWQIILTPKDQHFSLANSLIYLLTWTLTGELNFRHLQWLGSLNILALAWLIVMAYRQTLPRPLLLCLTALMLFQIQWWEAALWATSTLANFLVISAGLAALLAASQDNPSTGRRFAAIGLAALASSAQANGFLVWPLLAMVLCRRPTAVTAVLLLAGLLLAAIFVVTDTQAAIPYPALLSVLVKQLLALPIAYPMICGIAFSPQTQALPAWLAGIVINGMAIWLLLGRHRPSRFFMLAMAFLAGSCLMIALFRYPGPDAHASFLASRYRLYSVLLALLVMLELLRQHPAWLQRHCTWIACTAAALLFNLASWTLSIHSAVHLHDALHHNIKTWLLMGGDGSLGMSAFLIDHPERYLADAIQAGFYRPLSALKSTNKTPGIELVDCGSAVTKDSRIGILRTHANTIAGTRSVAIFLSDWNSFSTPPAIVLCADHRAYRLPLSKAQWLPLLAPNSRSAEIFIWPASVLPASASPPVPDRYRVLLEYPPGSGQLRDRGESIYLDWPPATPDIISHR